MNHLKFYKELYFKEFDRSYHIKQSLKIQIGIVTILLSATFYLYTTFNFAQNVIENCIYIILIIFTFISLIISILYILKGFNNYFKGYRYSYIAYSQDLNEWYNKLNKHYQEHYGDDSYGEQEFINHLIKNITKHVDHNIHINDIRSSSIYKSNIFLIISLFFLFCTTIMFSINNFQ